nr:MAG TPA: hypothetical protein [Caudoviricetes sp.]
MQGTSRPDKAIYRLRYAHNALPKQDLLISLL